MLRCFSPSSPTLLQLLQYKHTYGDTLVPSKWKPNRQLSKWVEAQRYEYTKLLRAREDASKRAANAAGTSELNADDGAAASTSTATCAKKKRPTNSRLTEERVRRLESIGFEWKVKNKMKVSSSKMNCSRRSLECLVEIITYTFSYLYARNTTRSSGKTRSRSYYITKRIKAIAICLETLSSTLGFINRGNCIVNARKFEQSKRPGRK